MSYITDHYDCQQISDKMKQYFYLYLISFQFEFSNRVLLLLDGLDEVHSVGNLANICQPAGHPEKPGIPGKGALNTEVTPLQFTQCLLTGSLLQGNLFFLARIFPKTRKLLINTHRNNSTR